MRAVSEIFSYPRGLELANDVCNLGYSLQTIAFKFGNDEFGILSGLSGLLVSTALLTVNDDASRFRWVWLYTASWSCIVDGEM